MNTQVHIFDRVSVRRHRDRAAPRFAAHRVLFDEVEEILAERIGDLKRPATRILDLGAHDGRLAARLANGAGSFVCAADLSFRFAARQPVPAVAGDEEWLPFAPESFDLILSNLSLHWVNDLPGALAQIRHALKPEGLFLASLFGGATLIELRSCLLDAELEISGGVSPRLSPSLDLQTASVLLQRAGFALPVTDHETFTLSYPDMFTLMRDVRGMGEANAHAQRLKHGSRRAVFTRAAQLYRERHGDAAGRIPATFDIVVLHGWKS